MHTFLKCMFSGENRENPNQLLINYSWTFLSPLVDANLALAKLPTAAVFMKRKANQRNSWTG